MISSNLNNRKVLIFGLGLLGGGVATAKWFYKKGAKLRITDLKNKIALEKSLKKLKNIKAKYILGKHKKEDFDWADIIAVNPGVSYKNEFIKYALEKGKIVENDCSLFFQYAKGDIIAITGTRGKTTTTTWIYELLNKFLNKKVILGGNQPDKSLLKIIDKTKNDSVCVLELSSFQLEFYRQNQKAPKIAIITNILNDHLNRYSSFEEYAAIKAKIFQNQTENDYLILNFDNQWTKFFVKLKPKSQIYFVSLKKLLRNLNGAFVENNWFYIKDNKKLIKVLNINNFKKIYGEHNLYNLLFSFLASFLYLKEKGIETKKILEVLKREILKLKTPEFRQQIIYKNKNLTIINDSAGTTPDATLAALKRFYKIKTNFILITGGTDKNLDFKNLAKEIKKKIKPENLILLNGSATQKLINELVKLKYQLIKDNICENLKDCFQKALLVINKKSKNIILFSPGAASFEKFKNEFDRGRKFNKITKIITKVMLK
jgi:UDP-N-acetylmuramoylalanine--D-glutamate ligase